MFFYIKENNKNFLVLRENFLNVRFYDYNIFCSRLGALEILPNAVKYIEIIYNNNIIYNNIKYNNNMYINK